MREIKFKTYNLRTKKIDYNPDYNSLSEKINDSFRHDKEIIEMQFTGLKDKNGKEIYEFDQLRGDWDVVNDIYLGTVEFYGGAFRIKETGLPLAWADKDKDCEVVGNKFEGLQNPSKGDIM